MTPASDLAVHAVGLTKDFKGTRAVDGLDLAVPAGCVYGFLGPNGAGKTTTVRMLATLLRPDAGTAAVLGHDVTRDPEAVRARIALTGQFAALDDDLTGAENLRVLARLLGHRPEPAAGRAAELLSAFGLDEAAGKPVKTYSGGMRRRLDVAASLIVTPELLFLDEPTTGLDPASRNQVWDVVRTLAAQGTTVLLTTQYLDEADQLADRLAVIDHGRLIAEGTPGELKAATGTGALHIRLVEPHRRDDVAHLLAARLDAPPRLDGDPAALTMTALEPGRALAVLTELEQAGVALASFALEQPSLDEVFLTLTGHTPIPS
ncbi:ATP-binding cassette domain-containing protein [Catenulispora subtropica]|uniref:Daunorubicin resistance protein DrrA family ABC transporter ATP-binding protein n=1 Tax=Catenulispora subtropica TaxID=450798 RepID=A0ABP5CRG4_9ACTN